MATYSIERLEDLPVLLGTWFENFNFTTDARPFSSEIHHQLDQQDSPVYYVLDMTRHDKMNLDDITQGASMGSRESDPNFLHRNTIGVILVTNKPAVKAAARGLRSDTFGNVNAHAFSTLEEALDFVRENH